MPLNIILKGQKDDSISVIKPKLLRTKDAII